MLPERTDDSNRGDRFSGAVQPISIRRAAPLPVETFKCITSPVCNTFVQIGEKSKDKEIRHDLVFVELRPDRGSRVFVCAHVRTASGCSMMFTESTEPPGMSTTTLCRFPKSSRHNHVDNGRVRHSMIGPVGSRPFRSIRMLCLIWDSVLSGGRIFGPSTYRPRKRQNIRVVKKFLLAF